MFIGLVADIDDDLAARMGSSWRDGCPVALDDLRYLTLSHWNFDGQPVEGELVVNVSVASDVVNVFQKMFAAEFPIQEMRLVADYGADDNASMAVNNTSAFNCRFVAGTQSWSKHALGLAIDINPLVNPYVQGSKIDPPGGAEFADRSIDSPGSINVGGDVTTAFADIGWSWGGAWNWPDYQHFSTP